MTNDWQGESSDSITDLIVTALIVAIAIALACL